MFLLHNPHDIAIRDVVELSQDPRSSDAIWHGKERTSTGHTMHHRFNWRLHAEVLAHPDRGPVWRPAA